MLREIDEEVSIEIDFCNYTGCPSIWLVIVPPKPNPLSQCNARSWLENY